MALGTSQEIQQSQILAHRVIQAVQILEYSHDDLDTVVREHLERNPLLCIAEEASQHATGERGSYAPRPYAPIAGMSRDTRTFDPVELLENLGTEISLQDHLRQQSAFLRSGSAERQHIDCLIDSLEPDGYLRTRLDDLAMLLETSSEALEKALELLQSLEPAGVGARDLKECLGLQLRAQGGITPTMEVLLDHLHLIETGDLKRLAKRCGLTIEALLPMLTILRRLNPKPGHQFNAEYVLPIVPDVIATVKEDGAIRVEINHELVPRLMLDREYFMDLSAQAASRKEVEFLQSCYRDANTLIHNIDQRMRTTLRIATEIVRNQTEFLLHGEAKMRPLSQKDIARQVGLHESTVSRTISNRYLLCPQGQVPFKRFFSERFSTPDRDEALSATAIRHHIKRLMSIETSSYILSDEDIAGALRQDGIDIARRTVAKYRQQLRIPSSADRRRRLRMEETSRNPGPQS